jgi:sugar phosphate isomerase/epimerase
MKLSVREGAFKATPAELPLEQSFARVAQLGYQGVELSTIPDREARGVRQRRGVWPGMLDGAKRQAVKQAAAGAGLEIPTLSSDWAWAYSDFHPTLDHWERGLQLLVEDARLTVDLGARVFLMHFGTSTGGWDQARGMLKELVAEAAKVNAIVGFEGSLFKGLGLGGQPELVRMVDEVGHPNLKIYVHPSGDTAKQVRDIEEVGDRIGALHASAINPEVDYGQVFAALRKVGYDWYWCFEVADDLIGPSAQQFKELASKHGLAVSA